MGSSVSVSANQGQVSSAMAGQETFKAARGMWATMFLTSALALSIIATGIAFTVGTVCTIGAIAAGASGFGAPAIVPCVVVAALSGLVIVGGISLTCYLIKKA